MAFLFSIAIALSLSSARNWIISSLFLRLLADGFSNWAEEPLVTDYKS